MSGETKQRVQAIQPQLSVPDLLRGKPPAITGEGLAREALRYLGYPSVSYTNPGQGKDTNGFDCSGFVNFLMASIGLPLPPELRNPNGLFDQFGVLVHEGLHRRGDLVFFSGRHRSGRWPTHVGILLSQEEYIHAPGKDGTQVEIIPLIKEDLPVTEPSQLYTHNPIGFKRMAIRLPGERWQRILRQE